jgi:hypothetical protein
MDFRLNLQVFPAGSDRYLRRLTGMQPGTLMSRPLFGPAVLMALLASFEAFAVIVKLSKALEGVLLR